MTRKIDDLAGSISRGNGDIRALEERKGADEEKKREHNAQIVEANRWKREHERDQRPPEMDRGLFYSRHQADREAGHALHPAAVQRHVSQMVLHHDRGIRQRRRG